VNFGFIAWLEAGTIDKKRSSRTAMNNDAPGMPVNKPLTRPKRGIWIPVVTGLIRQGGKVLLGLRPPGQSLAGAWEFPGGKINAGELPEVALRRELQEELGIDAEIGDLRLAHTHSYGDKGVLLLFYDVHFWKGQPRPIYHNDLKWAEIEDLHSLNIPEANKRILDKLLKILSDGSRT